MYPIAPVTPTETEMAVSDIILEPIDTRDQYKLSGYKKVSLLISYSLEIKANTSRYNVFKLYFLHKWYNTVLMIFSFEIKKIKHNREVNSLLNRGWDVRTSVVYSTNFKYLRLIRSEKTSPDRTKNSFFILNADNELI